jgi:putative DNA primase/helicase
MNQKRKPAVGSGGQQKKAGKAEDNRNLPASNPKVKNKSNSNYIPPKAENIPATLRKLPQWVLWRAIQQQADKKPTKFPADTLGVAAKTTDPATWEGFKEVWEAYHEDGGDFAGVGFVFAADDGFVGIDLDTCRNPETGELTDFAAEAVKRVKSYWEVSPSGCGLHCFLRGEIPGERRRAGTVEIYQEGRYFTVTGKFVREDRREITSDQEGLNWLYRQTFGEDPPASASVTASVTEGANGGDVTEADRETLRKAKKKSDRLRRLYRGDRGDLAGYASRSEADLALCSELLYFFGGDTQKACALFYESGLYREKWERQDYRKRTLGKALEGLSGRFFDWDSDIPSNEVLSHLDANEDGDAKLFIRLNRDLFVFDHAANEWSQWAGHHWVRDETAAATAAVESVIAVYLNEARRQQNNRHSAAEAGDQEGEKKAKKRAENLFKRSFSLRTAERKKKVLYLAARITKKPLCITGKEWDLQPFLIACSNGVYDLKAGEFRAGRREDYLKTALPHAYDPTAKAPTWERFLTEIFGGDHELVGFCQRLFGSAISGSTTEHVFPILWGRGRNGKTTLVETINFVLGPYAHKANAATLMESGRGGRQSGAADADTLALRGKRVVFSSETKEGKSLDDARVKELTGADTLNARAPYARQPVEFSPTHTVFLLTNHKPRIQATDQGIIERISLIPFRLAFVRKPKATDERHADPNLPERLRAEAPGILNWLIEGHAIFLRDGLSPPAAVQAATEEYQRENDEIGEFLESCTEAVPNSQIQASKLYDEYARWAEADGEPMTRTRFGREIKKHGVDSYRRNKGAFYIGLRLKE